MDAAVLPCQGATPWPTDLAVKPLQARPWFSSVRLSRLTVQPLQASMAAETGLCPLAFPGHGLANPRRTLAERLSPSACLMATAAMGRQWLSAASRLPSRGCGWPLRGRVGRLGARLGRARLGGIVGCLCCLFALAARRGGRVETHQPCHSLPGLAGNLS